jgi:hypothetical protein
MKSTMLENFLSRPECCTLTEHKKQVIRRYVRKSDYPIGRSMAAALIKLNARYNNGFQLVSDNFINYLYYC